jgi:hypothetical protein
MGTDLLEIRSGPSGPHPSAGTPLPQRGEGAGLVAAGSPVARRPPHRSRRAPKQKGGKRKGKRKGHRKCLGARRCILSGTPAGVPRFSAAPRRCRFAQPPATIRDASGIPGSTTSPVCMGPHPFAWDLTRLHGNATGLGTSRRRWFPLAHLPGNTTLLNGRHPAHPFAPRLTTW